MIDPLFFRAQLAMDESHVLREQRRILVQQWDDARSNIRRSMMESATARAEAKSDRDNGEFARLG